MLDNRPASSVEVFGPARTKRLDELAVFFLRLAVVLRDSAREHCEA